jgi:disulfide bond formation protein DsbB
MTLSNYNKGVFYMRKSHHLLITLFVILALGLVACGRKNDADNASQAAQAAPAGDPAAGKELFASTCSACHGPAGEGVPGLGKDMTASEFIAGKTDAELIAFIKQGRDPSDPLNTTGVAMPPKGGNPALNDQNLTDIIAYIRTLQK